MTTITLGGRKAADEERIYPKDAEFSMPTGERVVVTRSTIAGTDMEALFARHYSRYYPVGLFCRPGQRVLDFPCGPGYAAEIFSPFNVAYEGLDFDPVTVEYARHSYQKAGARFALGDLRRPELPEGSYEVIACIEGLEHIEMKYQDALIGAFAAALTPGGVLVVSSPENPSGVSGQSTHNRHHLGELTRTDFLALLHRHFPSEQVELVTAKATLSSGVTTHMFLGICHKA
jgi:2-polyprenyl-3-methyl-5-hydroxy-6-metoxy-1,4-benzoquinol methylase